MAVSTSHIRMYLYPCERKGLDRASPLAKKPPVVVAPSRTGEAEEGRIRADMYE